MCVRVCVCAAYVPKCRLAVFAVFSDSAADNLLHTSGVWNPVQLSRVRLQLYVEGIKAHFRGSGSSCLLSQTGDFIPDGCDWSNLFIPSPRHLPHFYKPFFFFVPNESVIAHGREVARKLCFQPKLNLIL